jgi:CHAT domain-containing protein/tetratricopeptide (TPR) repeat protein
MLIPPQAALALATVLAASRSVPIPPEGGRETFSLEPMQVRRHQVVLEAGEFFQATLHQRGVDAMARLIAPDGRVIEDGIDSSEGPAGREPVSMLATASGPHVIEVWPTEETTAVGDYDLETARPRLPSARDRDRLEAERLMAVGGRGMGPRAAATRPRPSAAVAVPALSAYRKALPIWERLGETCWAAEAATCIGIIDTWGILFPEASESLGRAIDGWLACEEPYKLAEAVLFLGRLRAAEGRLAEATEVYELGLPMAEGLDPVLTTQFLVQLTSASVQLGDTSRALEHGEKALPRVRSMGHLQGTAVVLTHLSSARYRRGDLQRASELALEALALRREVGEPAGLVSTLLLLAEVYQALGETDLALRYLDEANDGYGGINPIDEASARARTAVILQRAGQPGRAVAHLRRAIGISKTMWNPRIEIEPRLQLVELLMETGEWAEAGVEAQAIPALRERLEDRFVRAYAREVEGRLALHAGAPVEAAAALAESLALRRYVGDRAGEAATLLRQAELARAGGDLEAARTRLEEARAVVAAQRGTLASPVLRATWTSTVRGIDEGYVDVLMELHARDPSRGFDARAFEAGEAASARSLLELLGERHAGSGGGVPSAEAERERAARDRLGFALDRQMRARAAGLSARELDARAQEVRDLSAAHDRALAALRSADPRHASLVRPSPVSLADVQSRLLDDGTTLLSFWLGGARGHAWVVTASSLRAYELPARARVDDAVARVRRALAVPPAAGTDGAGEALRALAAMVLPRDRSWLRGSRLVVVADGSLHHVPFAALPDAAGRPLVARFEVTTVPSASVAAELRRQAAARVPAPRAVAVIADPVYDGADSRLHGPAVATAADAALVVATRDFGFADGRLPRLPFTRREALAITALDPAHSRATLDFGANLDAALSPDLASYRYVHFAAHGLLNDARPELSGLVLSLVDGSGRPRQGLLTAPDVAQMHLGADLVVLSSCRSAAGRDVRGEGLVGLTRAFMAAGAPRVVASLWPVDDVASAHLMTDLYRGMLGPATLPPAAALRRAQLAMLGHRKWKAPYYWAGFQLQGEWR